MINREIVCCHCESVLPLDTTSLTLVDGTELPLTCPVCEKTIMIETVVTYSFVPRKLSCLETDDHYFRPVFGFHKKSTYLDFYCFECDLHIRAESLEKVKDILPDENDYNVWFKFYSDFLIDCYPKFYKKNKNQY